MAKGTLRQILLITDGCSNKGDDPREVAARAFEQGITVNVIGVLEDRHSESPKGLREVEEIAEAGGGVSRIVYKEMLSQTVQMVTRQAMTQTIQGFINKELEQILGKGQDMQDLEPEKRGEVMEVVEDMGETCNLEVLVLVDTSASMHNKLATVKDSLLDLSLSLNARMGGNLFSIYKFPARNQDVDKVMDWSENLSRIADVFPKLTSGGITPTGPALKEALYTFGRVRLQEEFMTDEFGIEEA